MARLERYPVAVLTLLVGGVLTAGLWLAARQPYSKVEHGPWEQYEATPPKTGWTWEDGTPGYPLETTDEEWNTTRVRPGEMTGARRAAVRTGIDPEQLHVIHAVRPHVRGLAHVMLAAPNRSGQTCIGFQLHSGAARFVCPRELEDALGVFVADAHPLGRNRALYLMGIARAEVVRVAVETVGATYVTYDGSTATRRRLGPDTVYDRALPGPWWGAFVSASSATRTWHARVTFFDVRGTATTRAIRFDVPGERVLVFR